MIVTVVTSYDVPFGGDPEVEVGQWVSQRLIAPVMAQFAPHPMLALEDELDVEVDIVPVCVVDGVVVPPSLSDLVLLSFCKASPSLQTLLARANTGLAKPAAWSGFITRLRAYSRAYCMTTPSARIASWSFQAKGFPPSAANSPKGP